MKSLFDFIVEPLNGKYNNEIKVGDKSLVTNADLDNFRAVSNMAKVISTPLAYKTKISEGDTIVIHHNVFRTFRDIRGKQKTSRSKFTENLYFVAMDQVYMYKNKKNWNTFNNRCFVKPLLSDNDLTLDKERELVGILKYGNSSLEALKITPGDIVGYTPDGEYEFFIDGERLYCMKSNDIVIKYEQQGNEIEYNPSWAKSS
tara:strand:- start:1090 stop:1695 length:606 start_codon:yes stop_codon:yes gene_type:complete